MKKFILILDPRKVLGHLDLTEFTSVVYRTRLSDEDRRQRERYAAVLVDKEADADYDWVHQHKLTPRLVFGRFTARFEESRSEPRVYFIPERRFLDRVLAFLREHKRNGTLRAEHFDESPPALDPSEPSPPRRTPMLTLQTLRVQGVKSALDSTRLQVQNPWVLVGRNGSGKSTLLEALQWLQQAFRIGVNDALRDGYRRYSDFCTRGCSQIEITLGLLVGEERLALDYHLILGSDDGERPVIRSELCRFNDVEEIKTWEGRRILYPQQTEYTEPDRLALALHTAPGSILLRHFLQTAVFLRLQPREIAAFSPLHRTEGTPLLDEAGHLLPALLAQLSLKEKATLVQQLQDTLATGVESISVERNEAEQTGVVMLAQTAGRTGETQHLPAWVLSEGTRRIVALLSLFLARTPPGLIAIEEIENGLDPWTLAYVLQALLQAAGAGTNVLLTTHSPFFLDQFSPENILHVSIDKGTSSYRGIRSYEDVVRYEESLQPGVMYLANFFKIP